MNRRTFLAVAGSATVVMSGCLGDSNRSLPTDPSGEWLQQAHDRSNTGAADVDVPGRGNVAWDAGNAGSIEPLVVDGMVYSLGSRATALDAQTGEQEWEYEFDEQTGPTPALTDDLLIVPAGRRVVALRRSDGAEEWSIELPRPAEGALTVDPPVITVPLVARQGATGLVAYDGESGDRLWANSTLAASTTAIDRGTVFTTGYRQDGNTGILRAFSATDGALEWEVELDHPDAEPVVADGELLVADAGTLAVHDPDDGTRLRSLETFGDRIDESPAVAEGVAYLGARGGEIHALSINDGETLWQLDGSASRGISVGRETVVVSGESLPEV